MKVTFLVAIMISGLLLSVSSVYLNKMVFADDKWSDVAQRQQEQNARAALVYDYKYQFDNLGQSMSSYAGLSSVTTDENSKGRDIAGKSQMSMENALAIFDKEHIAQLTGTLGTGYPGLTSAATDEKARDRNALIVQGLDQTNQKVASLVSQLSQIAQSYSNMQSATATDEKTIDRQPQIVKTLNAQEAQAAALLNQIWQIDQSYVNLKAGPATNENTQGRQITAAQAYALSKAIQIFEEIHAQKLAALQATGYQGLTTSTTNEQISGPGWRTYGDRNFEINAGTEMALQNAINFYNAYYPNTPLNQPSYSH